MGYVLRKCHDARNITVPSENVQPSMSDLFFGLTPKPDFGHDAAWRRKMASLTLIRIETFLAHADSLQFVPRLKRYREVPLHERHRVAEAFSRRMASALTHDGKSVIICIEKPYLD